MHVDQLFKKAHAKHLQGKHDTAAKLYREILRIKPNHLDSNYLLGTLCAENNQLEEAQQYLAKADSLNPESPFIKVNLGNICKLQGDFETARKYFIEAIALKNDLPQAHFALGYIYEYVDEDFDAALREYQAAVDLNPNEPMTLQAIGKSLVKFGNQTALEYFARAQRLNPKLKGIQKDMGLAALKFCQLTEAAKHLRISLIDDPEDIHVRYFLTIAEGREPDDELKQRYVQAEFDDYSEHFDNSLTSKLGYDAPTKMLAFLLETFPETLHFRNGVDLGCGTGLFGYLIKKYVDHLTGIDLSGKMLENARKRGCYNSLVAGEIVSTLKEMDCAFDLFSATDVIIYIGDIDSLFSIAKEKSAPNALFLLTTESQLAYGFTLKATGRYTHSKEYVISVANDHGFSIVASREIPLRKESGEWLTGEMFIFTATPAS
jgi:predicted TPR repeat methyltransferase